jgi:hypothetical protein
MLFAPAEKNGWCVECLEISRQLNDAYADEQRESDSGTRSRTNDRGRTHAAVEALRRLVGGTEEDAEHADALLKAYRYQPQQYLPSVPPGAMAALSRCAQHAVRTGHWLRRIAG